jgi:hypothetical protein
MKYRALLGIVAIPLAICGCGGSSSIQGLTSNPKPFGPTFSFPAGKGGDYISPGFDAVEGNFFEITGGHNVVVTALGYEYERTSQLPEPTAIFDSNGNVLAPRSLATIRCPTVITGRVFPLSRLFREGNITSDRFMALVIPAPTGGTRALPLHQAITKISEAISRSQAQLTAVPGSMEADRANTEPMKFEATCLTFKLPFSRRSLTDF